MITTVSDLELVLDNYQTVISYNALPDEPEVKLPENKLTFDIPQSQDLDPFEIAEQFIEMYRDQKVAILIPGQKFDRHGNRKGRGGGWYDRLLSRVPGDWLRIGVCFKNQVSETQLDPQPHDQTVDILAIFSNTDPSPSSVI